MIFMNLMNNGQMDRGNEIHNTALALMTEGSLEKTLVRLVGPGI